MNGTYYADMKVLFLHGLESSPNSKKVRYLKQHGYEVFAPKLNKDCLMQSIVAARRAVDFFEPDIVIGSSRGGAVAMTLDLKGARLFLIAPAWKKYGVRENIPPRTVIFHSREDDIVPVLDSQVLLERSANSELRVVGNCHRMSDTAALDAIRAALEKEL